MNTDRDASETVHILNHDQFNRLLYIYINRRIEKEPAWHVHDIKWNIHSGYKIDISDGHGCFTEYTGADIDTLEAKLIELCGTLEIPGEINENR